MACRRIGNRNAPTRILCIQRSIFNDDVIALSKETDDIEFVFLPKGKLYELMCFFVEDHPEFQELSENNYHDGCCKSSIRKYGAYLGRAMRHFLNALPCDGLLSGNFGYKEQQELVRYFEERGLPFIVLFKEGLVIPAYLDELPKKLLKGKIFLGSSILFYSEGIRRAIVRSDAFEGRQYRTAVTGIPRLDMLVGVPRPRKKKIVFFSFYPPDKFRCFQSDAKTLERACEAGRRFHIEVIRFAESHPEWQVTIKTKVGPRYIRHMQEVLSEFEDRPENVEVTNQGHATDLLMEAQVVIAFTSTTSLEALVAGRDLICPDFSDLFGDEPWDYFQDYPELVTYVRTADDLEAVLEADSRAGNSDEEVRNEFLRMMVHGADGLASERVNREIMETLDWRRSLEKNE